MKISNGYGIVLAFIIVSNSHFSTSDDCESSFDCDAGAYCTFDGLDVGTCSYCSELGNKKCQDVGFIDADDEDECKLECEETTSTKGKTVTPKTESTVTKTKTVTPKVMEVAIDGTATRLSSLAAQETTTTTQSLQAKSKETTSEHTSQNDGPGVSSPLVASLGLVTLLVAFLS